MELSNHVRGTSKRIFYSPKAVWDPKEIICLTSQGQCLKRWRASRSEITSSTTLTTLMWISNSKLHSILWRYHCRSHKTRALRGGNPYHWREDSPPLPDVLSSLQIEKICWKSALFFENEWSKNNVKHNFVGVLGSFSKNIKSRKNIILYHRGKQNTCSCEKNDSLFHRSTHI